MSVLFLVEALVELADCVLLLEIRRDVKFIQQIGYLFERQRSKKVLVLVVGHQKDQRDKLRRPVGKTCEIQFLLMKNALFVPVVGILQLVWLFCIIIELFGVANCTHEYHLLLDSIGKLEIVVFV